ncbi:MAG: hypothetical protein V1799_20715 [bacterium]
MPTSWCSSFKQTSFNFRLGVIRSLPKTITKKEYYSIEKKFRKFAVEIQIPLDELDLLFWSLETGEIRK